MSDDHDDTPRRRLAVPAALAVAFVGSSAAITMWYGGCQASEPPLPPDAGFLEIRDDGGDPPADAEEDAPTGMDAATTPDAPRDAAPPPPDAPDH